MKVMLALPSEDWRLNLSVPVYSFPLCLQVEHMEVMLALPSEDWRSDLYRSDSCLHLLKPISLELTFKGRFHEIFGPLLRAFSVILSLVFLFPKI
jgi:hypothetical protein